MIGQLKPSQKPFPKYLNNIPEKYDIKELQKTA